MANENIPERALDDIRREVIEARNLVIKADNQLKTLHAEVKTVGRRQDEFQKRQWVSSAVTYAGFLGLCIAGAILLSNSRVASAGQEHERQEKQITELNGQIEKQKTDAAAQAAAERGASEVYKMMTTLPGEERLKGIDALNKLDQSKLSPFTRQALQDRAAMLRRELGGAALERGKADFRRQDFHAAVENLTRYLSFNPPEDESLEACYFLGNALIQLKKNDEAIKYLDRFVRGDRRAKGRDFAMLMLSQAYDATGQRDKAAEVAREAIGTYPNSEFLGALRLRLGMRTAANAAVPAAAPSPSPGAALDVPRQPLLRVVPPAASPAPLKKP